MSEAVISSLLIIVIQVFTRCFGHASSHSFHTFKYSSLNLESFRNVFNTEFYREVGRYTEQILNLSLVFKSVQPLG